MPDYIYTSEGVFCQIAGTGMLYRMVSVGDEWYWRCDA